MTFLRKRLALVLVLISGFLLLVAGVATIRWAFAYPDRPLPGPKRVVKLTIAKGSTFGQVLESLRKAGIVERPFLFRMFANSSGMAGRLRPGTYSIRPRLTPRALLQMFVRGPKLVLRRVTVPEGKNILEVAKLIAQAGISDEKSLVDKMRSRAFARSLGIPGDSVEGYLFPDTYRFRPDSSPELVIRTLVKRHRKVMRELKGHHPSHLIRLRNRFRFDDHEIVILASIVEKETGAGRERPLIAGVFLNRLSFKSFKSRKLETDPTIVYGCTVPLRKSDACRQFKGRIRRIHLNDAENPYNTYQHDKLPPGPISNPGLAALRAVIRPTKSRYLFFVSKNDGTHHFSTTMEEHQRAVDQHQRRRQRPPAGSAPMRPPMRAPGRTPRP
ncbi:MAG: endolytic transglycosylase MltG [bacterium]